MSFFIGGSMRLFGPLRIGAYWHPSRARLHRIAHVSHEVSAALTVPMARYNDSLTKPSIVDSRGFAAGVWVAVAVAAAFMFMHWPALPH